MGVMNVMEVMQGRVVGRIAASRLVLIQFAMPGAKLPDDRMVLAKHAQLAEQSSHRRSLAMSVRKSSAVR
jgi:hypothetical protein